MCILQDATTDVEKLQKGLKEIDTNSEKLAVHFCENKKSFKVEECINTMNTFCEKVKQCQKVKRHPILII